MAYWNSHRIHQLQVLCDGTKTVDEIAETMGRSATTIRSLIYRYRRTGMALPVKRQYSAVSMRKVKKAEKLIARGESNAKIAAILGVTTSAVQYYNVRYLHLPRTKRTKWKPHLIEELQQLWKSGTKYKEIAETMGLTVKDIYNAVSDLRRSGYDFPKRRAYRRKIKTANQYEKA